MITLRSTRLRELVRSHVHLKDIRSRYQISPTNHDPSLLNCGPGLIAANTIEEKAVAFTQAIDHRSEVHILDDAAILSSSGIIGLLSTSEIIEDTLDHTDPSRDGYVRKPSTVPGSSDQIIVGGPFRHTKGKFISLLLGNYGNYFHWLLMNVGRLALLQQQELMNSDGILIPADLTASQRELIDLVGVRNLAPVLPVSRREGLRVDRLVLPWDAVSPSGLSIDPAVVSFYRRLAGRRDESGPNAIYIDRRSSPVRRLLNEAAVVDRLRSSRVEPIQLQNMPLRHQIDAMKSARTIVAPHGAGLSNMVFAAPGARVIELMPSGAVNWCYRSLAAACGHRYDCVMGVSVPTGNAAPIWQPWHVAPADVMRAVAGKLGAR